MDPYELGSAALVDIDQIYPTNFFLNSWTEFTQSRLFLLTGFFCSTCYSPFVGLNIFTVEQFQQIKLAYESCPKKTVS